MTEVAVIKMSVKGQVVIPSDVRVEAGFQPADKLIAYASRDTVVFKKLLSDEAVQYVNSVFKMLDSKKLGIFPQEINAEVHSGRKMRK